MIFYGQKVLQHAEISPDKRKKASFLLLFIFSSDVAIVFLSIIFFLPAMSQNHSCRNPLAIEYIYFECALKVGLSVCH